MARKQHPLFAQVHKQVSSHSGNLGVASGKTLYKAYVAGERARLLPEWPRVPDWPAFKATYRNRGSLGWQPKNPGDEARLAWESLKHKQAQWDKRYGR